MKRPQNTHDSGQQTFSRLWFAKTTICFVGGNISGFCHYPQDSKFTYLALTNFFTEKKVADCNLLMKSADATWSRRSRQRTTGTGIKFIHMNWEYIALSSLHIDTFTSHLVPLLITKGRTTWQGSADYSIIKDSM